MHSPVKMSPPLRRTGTILLLATLAAFLFATAAAVRVLRVTPAIAGFGLTPLTPVYPILILVPGFIVLAAIISAITRLAPRLRWRSPDPDPEAPGNFGLQALSLAAVNLAPRLLVMPLTAGSKPALIPVLSVQAYRYILPFSILIGCEMILTAASFVRRRDSLWWRWKVVLDLAWCVGILWLITGPNLLIGDPLEWAAALGSSSIPQGWMIEAPRSLGGWWPAIQIILSVTFLTVLFGTLRDLLLMVKIWRREKKSV